RLSDANRAVSAIPVAIRSSAMALPPQPPGMPGAPGPNINDGLPPRTSAIASRVRLPVVGEWPGFVRFAPFGDARQVVLHRAGPNPMQRSLNGPVTRLGSARVGPFVVAVVNVRQEAVDDVLLLPDGELYIRRSPPEGFSDAEVSRIVASVELVSNVGHLPPHEATAAMAPYLAPDAPG